MFNRHNGFEKSSFVPGSLPALVRYQKVREADIKGEELRLLKNRIREKEAERQVKVAPGFNEKLFGDERSVLLGLENIQRLSADRKKITDKEKAKQVKWPGLNSHQRLMTKQNCTSPACHQETR